MNNKKIAFIGCGAMGSAIASAIATKIDPQQILLSDTFTEKAKELADTLGAHFIECPSDAAKAADWVILCTKPQTVEEVLHALAPIFADAAQIQEPKVLCSILAGVTLEKLASLLAVQGQAILRLMPNTPVLIGKGLGLLAANDMLTVEEKSWFLDVFAPCGELHFLEESLFDAGTVLASCSPAYVYQFIEYLSQSGVDMGISPDTSLRFAANAVLGAAAMVLHSETSPRALRDMVTSPGGSTIEGVRVLEDGKLETLIDKAAKASLKRNKELGG